MCDGCSVMLNFLVMVEFPSLSSLLSIDDYRGNVCVVLVLLSEEFLAPIFIVGQGCFSEDFICR